MAEDTENHTIRLLQEMRGELKKMRVEVRDVRQEMNARFDRMDDRLDDTNLRIDGLSHMMMLLAGNVGSHHDRIETLEQRVDAIPSGT